MLSIKQLASTTLISCGLIIGGTAQAKIAYPSQRMPMPETPVYQGNNPQIDVVFVLDTTGSMSGLIEGAKKKIWSIANSMLEADKTPTVRFGLIGYRDRGEAYVTRKYDLTEDMDSIYDKLLAFKARGGGDRPESVNQALHEAITQMSWDMGDNVLRMVFLVGDAPPHMDYQDDVKYPESVKLAARKNIVVSAVQCGSIRATTPIWREIARYGDGQYIALSQSGNMRTVSTPYDKKIAELTDQQEATLLNYGKREEKARFQRKRDNLKNAPASTKASKATYGYNMAAGKRQIVLGRGDLVTDLEKNRVDLSTLSSEELPKPMQSMNEQQRRKYLRDNKQKRVAIRTELDALIAKRNAYVKEERARLSRGKRDSFDAKVQEIVSEKAKRINLTY